MLDIELELGIRERGSELMPTPRGDEYWAMWCDDYVALARRRGTSHKINKLMGELTGQAAKGVATTADRMRERGFLQPYSTRTALPALTEAAQQIVDRVRRRQEANVVFTVEVAAKSKVEALAEVWDVIQQLEHWDDRNGEPFHYKPHRITGA
jgi:hypothetical protein